MLILGAVLMLPVIHSSYADVSPVEAVILIKEDQNKTVFYQPSNTTGIIPLRADLVLMIPWQENSLTLIKLTQKDL